MFEGGRALGWASLHDDGQGTTALSETRQGLDRRGIGVGRHEHFDGTCHRRSGQLDCRLLSLSDGADDPECALRREGHVPADVVLDIRRATLHLGAGEWTQRLKPSEWKEFRQHDGVRPHPVGDVLRGEDSDRCVWTDRRDGGRKRCQDRLPSRAGLVRGPHHHVVSTIADSVLRIVMLGRLAELLRGTGSFVPGLDLPYEVAGRDTDDGKIEVEEGLSVDPTVGAMYCRRHLDQCRGDSRACGLAVEQVSNQRRPLAFVKPGDPVDDLSVKTARFVCHAAMMPEARGRSRRLSVGSRRAGSRGREEPAGLEHGVANSDHAYVPKAPCSSTRR